MKKALFTLIAASLLGLAEANPLLEAVTTNCTVEVLERLTESGVGINATNENGWTTLMVAAAKNTHPEVLEKLVELGADITGEDGREAAWIAAQYNNSEIMKTMIALGADIHSGDSLGGTILMDAARRNSHTDVLDVLVKAGVKVDAVDDFGHTAIIDAVKYNSETDALERLVKLGADVNHKTKAHMTALNYTSGYRDLDITRRLLVLGADVNAATDKGNCKIIYAGKFKDDAPLLDLLLEYGANVNIRANDGTTPLMKASEYNNAYSIYTLVKKGADPTPVDEDGMSALDYADRYAKRVEATEKTEVQIMLKAALQAWAGDETVIIPEPKLQLKFSKCFLKYSPMNGATEIILYDIQPSATEKFTKARLKRAFDLSEFEIEELMFSEPGTEPTSVRMLASAHNFMRNAPVEQLFSNLLNTQAEVELQQQSFPQMMMNVVLPIRKNMYVGENNALDIFQNEDETKRMIMFDISSEPIEVVIGWRKNTPKPEPKSEPEPDHGLQLAVQQFQRDADVIRLEHILYWSELIEEYHQKKGSYPLQDQLKESDMAILVKVATKIQRQFLSPGSTDYRPDLDMNGDGLFKELPVKEFVSELQNGLGREIPERYDIQKAPTDSPVGYYYFSTPDGYLLWCICPTFGVSTISTLLNNGVTPSVNIVSDGMVGKVTKALTRQALVENPVFKEWQQRTLSEDKESYVRQLIAENEKDSKNP